MVRMNKIDIVSTYNLRCVFNICTGQDLSHWEKDDIHTFKNKNQSNDQQKCKRFKIVFAKEI